MEEDGEESDSNTDVKEQASQKVRIVWGSGGQGSELGLLLLLLLLLLLVVGIHSVNRFGVRALGRGFLSAEVTS